MNFSEQLDQFVERESLKHYHDRIFKHGAASLKPIVLRLYDSLKRCDYGYPSTKGKRLALKQVIDEHTDIIREALAEVEQMIGSTLCQHNTNPFDCAFCRTDESKMVVAITDGPIAVENITIDQRYRFLQMIHLKDKEIARLRAALEDIRAEVDDDGDDGHGGYLLDVCREALAGGKDES